MSEERTLLIKEEQKLFDKLHLVSKEEGIILINEKSTQELLYDSGAFLNLCLSDYNILQLIFKNKKIFKTIVKNKIINDYIYNKEFISSDTIKILKEKANKHENYWLLEVLKKIEFLNITLNNSQMLFNKKEDLIFAELDKDIKNINNKTPDQENLEWYTEQKAVETEEQRKIRQKEKEEKDKIEQKKLYQENMENFRKERERIEIIEEKAKKERQEQRDKERTSLKKEVYKTELQKRQERREEFVIFNELKKISQENKTTIINNKNIEKSIQMQILNSDYLSNLCFTDYDVLNLMVADKEFIFEIVSCRFFDDKIVELIPKNVIDEFKEKAKTNNDIEMEICLIRIELFNKVLSGEIIVYSKWDELRRIQYLTKQELDEERKKQKEQARKAEEEAKEEVEEEQNEQNEQVNQTDEEGTTNSIKRERKLIKIIKLENEQDQKLFDAFQKTDKDGKIALLNQHSKRNQILNSSTLLKACLSDYFILNSIINSGDFIKIILINKVRIKEEIIPEILINEFKKEAKKYNNYKMLKFLTEAKNYNDIIFDTTIQDETNKTELLLNSVNLHLKENVKEQTKEQEQLERQAEKEEQQERDNKIRKEEEKKYEEYKQEIEKQRIEREEKLIKEVEQEHLNTLALNIATDSTKKPVGEPTSIKVVAQTEIKPVFVAQTEVVNPAKNVVAKAITQVNIKPSVAKIEIKQTVNQVVKPSVNQVVKPAKKKLKPAEIQLLELIEKNPSKFNEVSLRDQILNSNLLDACLENYDILFTISKNESFVRNVLRIKISQETILIPQTVINELKRKANEASNHIINSHNRTECNAIREKGNKMLVFLQKIEACNETLNNKSLSTQQKFTKVTSIMNNKIKIALEPTKEITENNSDTTIENKENKELNVMDKEQLKKVASALDKMEVKNPKQTKGTMK